MARRPQPTSSRTEIDETTGAAVQVSHGHHEIHEGRSYTVSERTKGLASAGTLALAFKTPPAADRLAHLLVSWSASAAARMEIFEGSTWATPPAGAMVPIINRNRAGGESSHVLENQTSSPDFVASDQVIKNPSTLAGGTPLTTQSSFASQQSIAGARGSFEFVLAADTQYAVVMTAEAASVDVELELDWYEEPRA